MIVLVWVIGVMVLVEGLISLFVVFGNSGVLCGWLLFYVVVLFGFGVLVLFNLLVIVSVLILLLVVWLIVVGLYCIVFVICVCRYIWGEWLLIFSGLLVIVLGVFMVVNFIVGVVVIMLWIGIGSLIYGVL